MVCLLVACGESGSEVDSVGTPAGGAAGVGAQGGVGGKSSAGAAGASWSGTSGQSGAGGKGGAGGSGAGTAGQGGAAGSGGSGQSGAAGSGGKAGAPFRPPVPLPEPPKVSANVGLLTITTITSGAKSNANADSTDFEICLSESYCVHALRSDREFLKDPTGQAGAGGQAGTSGAGGAEDEEHQSGAYRDRLVGGDNVYYAEPQISLPRASLDRMVIRPLKEAEPNTEDSWTPSCVSISADGVPIYCAAVATKLTETGAPFQDDLKLDCGSCYGGPLGAPVPNPEGTLTHGPMLGPPTTDSVTLWMRADATRLVTVSMATVADFSDASRVAAAYPSASDDFTLSLTVKELDPDKTYFYRVEIDGKPVTAIAPIRTAPKGEGGYRFLLGSCARRGTASGGIPPVPPLTKGNNKYQTFDRLLELLPNPLDMMVYVGDVHYGKTTELDKLRWNYRVTRGDRFLLHNQVPTLAVWDDHDFGPNAPSLDTPNEPIEPIDKKTSARVFREYFSNPFAVETGPIYFQQRYGDVEFFGLDTRYFRADLTKPQSPYPKMLGDKQTEWLLDALEASTATFKIVVSGSKYTPASTSDKAWGEFHVELGKLYDALHARKISGVVFASGGPHHSEIRTIKRPNGYPITELVSSAMSSSGSVCPTDSTDTYKLERCAGSIPIGYDENGKLIDTDGHSVILLQVQGTGAERRLRARIAIEYPTKNLPGGPIPGTEIPDEPGVESLTILGEPYDITATSLKE